MAQYKLSSRALGLCLVACFSFVACGDDDDDSAAAAGSGGQATAGKGGAGGASGSGKANESAGGKGGEAAGGKGGAAGDGKGGDAAGGAGGKATGGAGGEVSGGAGGDAGGNAEKAAVVLSLLIRNPEGFSEYLIASEKVPEGEVDTSRGFEVSGGNVYRSDDALYYDNWDRGTLQRYTVNPDYSMKLAGEFSYSGFEWTGGPFFMSSTLAYVVDGVNAKLIKFDPSQMSVTGEVDIKDLMREGYTLSIATEPEVLGDTRVAVAAYYRIDEDPTKPQRDFTVAVVTNDEAHPLKIVSDDRFTRNGSSASFLAEDGTFYGLMGEGNPYDAYVNKTAPEAKLYRLKKGADKIDADYSLDIVELLKLKYPYVNGVWPIGGNKFAIQGWSDDQDPAAVVTETNNFYVQPYYDWYWVDADTKEFGKFEGVPKTALSYEILRLKVGEQLYLQNWVFKDFDYETGRIEVYAAKPDGTAAKQFATERGDIRIMAKVKVTESK